MGRHFLLKNNGNGNHYLKINLKGVESNLNGIGARVTVTYNGKIVFRENNGGAGGEWALTGSRAPPLRYRLGQFRDRRGSLAERDCRYHVNRSG